MYCDTSQSQVCLRLTFIISSLIVRYFAAIPHLEEVAEHMESVDDSARKLSYSLAKGDPRYTYFNATEEFTSGPEKGTTTATWVATYSPAGDLGAPEHIKNKVVSKWKVIEEAVKANPKLYV